MKVSIVVTCFNEAGNIGACVQSLLEQDYPKEKCEIVISDGGSRDKTQEIVKEYMKKEPRLKLVVEKKKGTAAGRNAGIKSATFDYIAFIDADCEAPPDWLSLLVAEFKENVGKTENLVAVGGRNIAPAECGRFVKAIETALDSYPGSFSSAQGRQFKEITPVTSLATVNVLYDKRKVTVAGMFDETLGSEAEDAELNYRLYTEGNRFLFVPRSYVWHKMRSTPGNWAKNMFRYGKGRARLLKRYPGMWKPAYLLPLLFLLGMTTSVLSPISWLFALPLLYFPAIILFSIFHTLKKKKPGHIFSVMAIYVIQHFGYALGEAYGLINPKIK
ncbi:MAG: glycosyltransferase [bacterium]|nr:glycosyltransferase [bacterium]